MVCPNQILCMHAHSCSISNGWGGHIAVLTQLIPEQHCVMPETCPQAIREYSGHPCTHPNHATNVPVCFVCFQSNKVADLSDLGVSLRYFGKVRMAAAC